MIRKMQTTKMRLDFIDLALGTEIFRLGSRPIPRLQPIHQLEFAGLDEHRFGFCEVRLVVLLGNLMLCAEPNRVSLSKVLKRVLDRRTRSAFQESSYLREPFFGLGIVLHPMKHAWLVLGVENLEVCTLGLCGNEFVHRLQGCQECFAVLWEDVHSDVQGYSVALVRHG